MIFFSIPCSIFQQTDFILNSYLSGNINILENTKISENIEIILKNHGKYHSRTKQKMMSIFYSRGKLSNNRTRNPNQIINLLERKENHKNFHARSV